MIKRKAFENEHCDLKKNLALINPQADDEQSL